MPMAVGLKRQRGLTRGTEVAARACVRLFGSDVEAAFKMFGSFTFSCRKGSGSFLRGLNAWFQAVLEACAV